MLPCFGRQACLPWSLGGPCIPPVLITQNSLWDRPHKLTAHPNSSSSRSICTFLTHSFPHSAQKNSKNLPKFPVQKIVLKKNFHRYHPHYLRNVVKDPCPSVQANPKWANSAQTMSMNSLNSVKINIKRSHQLGEAECVSNLLFLECKYMHHDFSWAIINENRITCRSC